MILGEFFDQAIRIAAPPLIQARPPDIGKMHNTAIPKDWFRSKIGHLIFVKRAAFPSAPPHTELLLAANPL